MINKDIVLKTDTIGFLRYKDIITFYDYPRVFVCQNGNNELFVFSEYEVKENDYSWIVCLTNEKLINCLDKNMISLQELYNASNSKYIVTIKRNEDVAKCDLIEKLPIDCFVDEPLYLGGFLLNKGDEHIETIKKLASDTGRAIVSVKTRKRFSDFLSVPAEKLKELIEAFKNYCKQYKYKIDQDVCFAHGSTLVNFIINSEQNAKNDIIDFDSSDQLITDFETLINAKSSQEISSIYNINDKKIAKFNDFIGIANDEDGECEIIYTKREAKPTKVLLSKEEVSLKREALEEAQKILEAQPTEKIVRLTGILSGILTKNNRFEFTSNNGDLYKGTIDSTINLDKTFFVNGKEYCVSILVKNQKRGSPKYILLEVSEPVSIV